MMTHMMATRWAPTTQTLMMSSSAAGEAVKFQEQSGLPQPLVYTDVGARAQVT